MRGVGIDGIRDPAWLTRVVGRVMAVEDVTLGAPKQPFVLRARGRLLVDSDEAYGEVAAQVREFGLIPVLRREGESQVILIVPDPAPARAGSRNWLHLALFLFTLASVIYTSAYSSLPPAVIPCDPAHPGDLSVSQLLAVLWTAVRNIPAGFPFAFSLLAVLGAHELGHYFAGRRNGTPVTLPFFIPLPLINPFGTLGALISMRRPPRNRNALTEIAVAGPLAGFAVALPLLLYGLTLSTVEPLPVALDPCTGFSMEGNSILYLLAKLAVFGRLLPAPAVYGIPPVLFWLRSFFTGFPAGTPGVDVFIHPIASGAWAGLMVTGLNLIPAGQLDGGHLLYTLLGERANRALPWIIAALVLLGMFWPGWLLLAFLVFLLGRQRAEPLDSITPQSARHRALAVLGLVLFVLLFTPVPLQVFGG
jgi:hypothetical protein